MLMHTHQADYLSQRTAWLQDVSSDLLGQSVQLEVDLQRQTDGEWQPSYSCQMPEALEATRLLNFTLPVLNSSLTVKQAAARLCDAVADHICQPEQMSDARRLFIAACLARFGG